MTDPEPDDAAQARWQARPGPTPGAAWIVTAQAPDGLIAAGAGRDEREARLRALSELAERRAQFATRPATIVGPAADLPGVLDPRSFGLYGASQYRRPGFPCVPYDSAQPRDWIGVEHVLDGQAALVPVEFVHPRAQTVAGRLVKETSSGSAAGQDAETALCHALAEAVERDALMRWWYRHTELHLASIADLSAGVALQDCEALVQGGDVVLAGFLPEAAWPCAVAVAMRGGRSWIGSACAPTAPGALQRALRELAQTRTLLADLPAPMPSAPTALSTAIDHHALYQAEPWASAFRAFLGRTARLGQPWPQDHDRGDAASLARELAARRLVPWVRWLRGGGHTDASPAFVARVLLQGAAPFSVGFGMERLGNPRLAGGAAGQGLRTLMPHCYA